MENFPVPDTPPVQHVLAPYAGQLLAMVQGKAANIPDEVKNDASALGAFFQEYHDMAHDLQKDGEFNFADLLRVREGIDALQRQVSAQVMSELGKTEKEVVPEAA